MTTRKKTTPPVAPEVAPVENTTDEKALEQVAQEELQALTPEQQDMISITGDDIIRAYNILSQCLERGKDALELDELMNAGTVFNNMKGFVKCINEETEFEFGHGDIEAFVVIVSAITTRKNVFGIDEFLYVGRTYNKFVQILNISKQIRELSQQAVS